MDVSNSPASGEQGRETTERARVLLIEDDVLIEYGLNVGLRKCPAIAGLELMVADSIAAALEMERVRPDAILLDVRLCGGRSEQSLEMLQRVREHFPDSPVGLLSVGTSAHLIHTALEQGVAAVIPRTTPMHLVAIAIKLMMAGGVYLPPDFASLLIKSAGSKDAEGSARRASGELTRRQQAILELLASGASNREIALRLRLSVGTVKNYVSGLLKMMQMPTRNRLVAHLRERDGATAERCGRLHLPPEDV